MHIPVLLQEAIESLQIKPDNWYLDGTFGRGGHTSRILKLGGKVVAFDVDPEAIAYGQETLQAEITSARLILIQENFVKAAETIKVLQDRQTIGVLAGALFDFGTSSDQLMSDTRGFSFDSQAELDMRMDTRLGVKAIDLLKLIDEKQLAHEFALLGGEREAKSVAKALKRYLNEHQNQEAQTAASIAQVIAKTKHEPRGRLHPATKVFQALRILVNGELEVISQGLPRLRPYIQPGGRIVTIAFHEGEDRIIKHMFADWEKNHLGKRINRDVIIPGTEEQERNPRARSAKLRIFEV
jgi:16S rRNA (cytosine1402-N4)-methyltransferase